MGNFRSRSGCLTCRARRVKCDETRPVCKACSKKNRPCQWDSQQTKFKEYQPEGSSAQSTAAGSSKNEAESGDAMDFEGSETSQHSRTFSPTEFGTRRGSQADTRSEVQSATISQSSDSPLFLTSGSRSQSAGSVPVGSLLRPPIPDRTIPHSHEPVDLTHDTALLLHHYAELLGRWLDCTDATRQFTLGVPEKVKECPILFHAVLSFAARHKGDELVAQGYYQHCIALLIDRLNEVAASHDETLLCAIVILRFYEQLSVPTTTGSDAEQHLAGTSAILRASQGHHFLDPSAPTLREAAFWVYVRQCLYNSTINQQPPDIDFSLQLHPRPSSLHDSHPLARLRLETAWANQMTWHLACIVNFCFDGVDSDRSQRSWRWQSLWEEVQEWLRLRPRGFDPIWQGERSENQPFPSIWFTADWHAISFGFFHFACILLLTYKPGPKFAIRNIKNLSDTDLQVLEHARLICGASQSSPATVPLNITLCHTVFIWGPLVQNRQDQEELTKILNSFEANHKWPTTWIITALREQWVVA